jgi:hypothetical protein
MITREKALQLRAIIEKAAASLSDADALDAVELFPAWEADTEYARGVRIRYDGKLYRCEQAHTSQSIYPPDIIPALWTEVAAPGEIPVWKQPTGAQDAYMTGDKVWYPEKDTTVYVSLIDNNTWSPEAYPAGWEAVE